MADADNLLNGKVDSAKGVKNNSKRMSNLLFWQMKNKGNSPQGPNGRNWIHAPDLLVKGHVAYLVKFLGSTPVDQPKGIEVVKDAIKKLNFNQQLKAKENAKCKKVEITISVDGVAIQEPRSQPTIVLHQFPLHRISYCADDKGAKKYFSFIAKGQPSSNGQTNGHSNGDSEKEHHECFVFVSTKLAAEITLTIGQAFDLAYRRFIQDNGKYVEMQKLTLQNKKLELQMTAYKTRLIELSRLTYKDDLQSYLSRSGLADITEFKTPPELASQMAALSANNGFTNGNKTPDLGIDLSASLNSTNTYNSSHNESNNLLMDSTPTQNGVFRQNDSNHISDLMDNLPYSKIPEVGTKLQGVVFDSDSDGDFDPRACEITPPTSQAANLFPGEAPRPYTNGVNNSPPPPLLAPPPKTSKRQQPNPTTPQPAQNGSDLFGSGLFTIPNPSPTQPIPNSQILQHNLQNIQSFNTSSSVTPNYDISDFDVAKSVFNTSNTSFTNGLAGYDPFETQKFGNGNNIFGNGYGNNSFGSNGGFNGFGGLSEKQSVALDSNFSGFLDKRINEMKDGFSRGITFGNDDFSIDNLDPLKKN